MHWIAIIAIPLLTIRTWDTIGALLKDRRPYVKDLNKFKWISRTQRIVMRLLGIAFMILSIGLTLLILTIALATKDA